MTSLNQLQLLKLRIGVYSKGAEGSVEPEKDLYHLKFKVSVNDTFFTVNKREDPFSKYANLYTFTLTQFWRV
jgi:hypothetical protein